MDSDTDFTTDSDDEEFCLIETNAPILQLRDRIVEPLTVYSYMPLAINILWIVEDYRPTALKYEKIALACQILNMHELRAFRHVHYSMVENLHKLIKNDRLKRFRKKKSIFSLIYNWITQ